MFFLTPIMDLVIDPIDITGDVPQQAFGFITGYDTEIPIEHHPHLRRAFVPLAVCQFFLERSRLEY